MTQYPLLKIDCGKLAENTARITGLCAEYGIRVAGVAKGFNGRKNPAVLLVKEEGRKVVEIRRRDENQDLLRNEVW